MRTKECEACGAVLYPGDPVLHVEEPESGRRVLVCSRDCAEDVKDRREVAA